MTYKKDFTAAFPGIFNFTKPEGEKGRHMNGNALILYLYVSHHYCMSDKNCIVISYNEIRSGTLMDKGLGLSKSGISKGLETLVRLRLLKVKPLAIPPKNGQPPKTVNRFRPMCPLIGDKGDVVICDFSLCPNFGQPEISRSEFQTPSSFHSEEKSGVNSFESSNKDNKYPLFNNTSTDKSELLAPTTIAEEFASILWKALGKKKRLNSRLVGWRRVFTDCILDNDDLDTVRFRKVLMWYCRNIGKKYIPKALCAKTFCEKFTYIEDAMERQQSDNSSNPADRTWTDQQGPSSFEEPELTEEVEELRNQTMADKI